jgi:predicted HicB family RNase H-like nuclease
VRKKKRNWQKYHDKLLIEMQKEIDMDLRIRISESQYEALKMVAEASGDTLDEYLHSCVIQGIESDIDLYYGKSQNIKEKLYKQVGDRNG